MKYRDPETGKVFDTIEDARTFYCEGKYCLTCGLPNKLTGSKEFCTTFSQKNKQKAVNLMGYEIIEDEKINQVAKADAGKPRPTLVPVSLINAVTAVREYGCKKYHDPENWRKVDKQRYKDAAYRHWLKYIDGEENDEESGLPHLWHLACNVSFLIEIEDKKC